MKFEDMKTEFSEFMKAEKAVPPRDLTEALLAKVQKDLNPSFNSVFLKVLAIHAGLSLVTLSICSQFGLQLFPLLNLMDAFMAVAGHTYCMAFCGALYLSVSAFSLSFILRPEEVLAVRKNSVLQVTILAFISLGVFVFFGAEVLLAPALLWLGGALIAGIASLEIGWNIRGLLARKSLS